MSKTRYLLNTYWAEGRKEGEGMRVMSTNALLGKHVPGMVRMKRA